jgi:isopenicillin N synthase-like dioxygenase
MWDAAMRRFGFVLITGHGIPEALLDGVYEQAQAFFARPLPEKMQLCFPDLKRGQGYGPLLNETVGKARDAGARPDLCESLCFTATPGARANLWPQDMPGFRSAIENYIAAANALSHDLMRLSALALHLPPDFFASTYTRMNSDLRCVLYPDQPAPPEDGQLRYGPHTDFGGFTLLRQDSAPGGLQVLVDGAWLDVTPMPGTLVVNAGDLVQRWSNDVWKSNVHRVQNPPRDARTGTRRLSIVLFTGPNDDALIQALPGTGAPRHAPILAGAHMEARMTQTYGNLAP